MALLGNNQSNKFEKHIQRIENRDGGFEMLRLRVAHIEKSIAHTMQTPAIIRNQALLDEQVRYTVRVAQKNADVYVNQPVVKIPMGTVATVESNTPVEAPVTVPQETVNNSNNEAAARQRLSDIHADTHNFNLPG